MARTTSSRALLAILACAIGGCGGDPTAPPIGPTAEPEARAPEAQAPEAQAPEAPELAIRGEALCAEWLEAHTGWCEPTRGGAWWFEREAARVSCGLGAIPEEGERGRMRFGYRTSGGARDASAWEAFDDCTTTVEYTRLGHADWDGDGHEELVVRRAESYVDGGETAIEIRRFADGHVAPFDGLPAVAGAVHAVRDADGDGLLDLETKGPHMRGPFESDCCSNVYAGGPSTLWHARADHTWSRSDAVARAHLRAACGAIDGALMSQDLIEALQRCDAVEVGGAVEQAVTCARLGGQSAETIATRLAAELAARPCSAEAECCSEARSAADQLEALARAVDAEVVFAP